MATTRSSLPTLLCLCLALLAACGEPPPAAPGPSGKGQPAGTKSQGVVATVNGAPITEADLALELKAASHEEIAATDQRQAVLETIIRRELVYQRAVSLGLDADPGYQAELQKAQAQLDAFKRRGLSELFFRQEVAKKAELTDAELQKYFDENAERIRTELHVFQLLLKSEAQVEQARKEIEAGTPFEEVAARQFPKLPAGVKAPWDLGFLTWVQVPEPWRPVVYSLKPGETSGVIRGPKNRFWLVKLVEKRENPALDAKSAGPAIATAVRASRVEELRASTEKELRSSAKVVILPQQPVAPPTE